MSLNQRPRFHPILRIDGTLRSFVTAIDLSSDIAATFKI